MKTLYNKKLCIFLKIDPYIEYHLNDIIKLFYNYKYEDGYLIDNKIINLFKENNNNVNWKYLNENKFKKLIYSLRLNKYNSNINKLKFNDIGILVTEIII